MLCRLDDGQAPALLARRQQVHPRSLQHMVFRHVVDVAVERHRIRHAEPLRVVHQPLAPPAAADDVEVQARHAGPQRRDRLQRVFDLLVRYQPRQHHHPRRRRARPG